MARLVYSTVKKKLVELAREGGHSDCEILRRLLRGEYGVIHRKRLLLDWADAIGMEPSEILHKGVACGLLLNARMPQKN